MIISRQSTEGLQGSETSLCDTIMMHVSLTTHSSKPTECTTARVKPNVNSGLWVTTMCPCRFTDHNKCTTPVWDVDSGEAVHMGGRGHMGALYFLLSFAENLKLL